MLTVVVKKGVTIMLCLQLSHRTQYVNLGYMEGGREQKAGHEGKDSSAFRVEELKALRSIATVNKNKKPAAAAASSFTGSRISKILRLHYRVGTMLNRLHASLDMSKNQKRVRHFRRRLSS